jgi:hypothetical protein
MYSCVQYMKMTATCLVAILDLSENLMYNSTDRGQ